MGLLDYFFGNKNNSDEAQDNLLKENPWIIESGFDESEFIVRQLAK